MVLFIKTEKKLIRGIRRDIATRVHLYLQGGDWEYLTYCESRGVAGRLLCSYGQATVYAVFELLSRAFPYSIWFSPMVLSDLARSPTYGYQFVRQGITVSVGEYLYYTYNGWITNRGLPSTFHIAQAIKTPGGQELDLKGRFMESLYTTIPSQLSSFI